MTDKLRAGISMVKMCGETVQGAIAEARSKVEEFKSLKHFLETVDRRRVNRRVIKMLIAAGCFDQVFEEKEAKLWKLYFDDFYDAMGSARKTEKLLEEKSKTVEDDWLAKLDDVLVARQEALNFSLDDDIYGQYRKLVKLVKDHVKIREIADVDDSKKDDKEFLYIARPTSVKFGYRDRIKNLASKVEGTKDALGGIYGNIDDGTAFMMAIYRPELYRKKKKQVETLKGEVCVFSANHPMPRRANLWVSNFVRLQDLAKGNPGFLKLKVLQQESSVPDTRDFEDQVRSCTQCPLHKGCKAPVPPSIGQCNIMVLGEAPGADEDREGVGYTGRAGEVLWRELKRVGIHREHCIVANTVACRPPNNKLPNITYILKCPWATEVIKAVQPKFILATGNAALYYFKRQPKGITEWSGRTEWDNRAAAWITYSVHPSSTFYHEENKPKLREACEEFARVIGNFS